MLTTTGVLLVLTLQSDQTWELSGIELDDVAMTGVVDEVVTMTRVVDGVVLTTTDELHSCQLGVVVVIATGVVDVTGIGTDEVV